MRHAGPAAVGHRAAKFLMGDFLMGDRLDHIRPRHEHVGGIFHHKDEIRHRRGINRPAGTGAHDHRNLRHHAGRHHVALKHLRIACQRRHTFLNTCTAGIIQPDHRRTDFHGLIHDLADLLGMRLAQRAAKNGKVLREHENGSSVDRSVSGDHAVTGNPVVRHTEIGTAMLNEHVPLFETVFVKEQTDSLTRRQLALCVLGGNPAFSAPCPC